MLFRRNKNKAKHKTGREAARGRSAGGKGGAGKAATGAATARQNGAAPRSREEAERQILQRLADGSAERQRRLASLRDATQLFDDHPDEAARLVRTWLSDRKG